MFVIRRVFRTLLILSTLETWLVILGVTNFRVFAEHLNLRFASQFHHTLCEDLPNFIANSVFRLLYPDLCLLQVIALTLVEFGDARLWTDNFVCCLNVDASHLLLYFRQLSLFLFEEAVP